MLQGAAAAAGVGDPLSPHYPRPFNPTPPWPHGFPIEGAPPDITRWAAGNTGIPCLWSFDGPAPGPHAALVALTHGEEWCGAHALDALLQAGIRPLRGRLSLLFHNWRAHARWNPAEPNRAFHIDRDLNRVWDPALLGGERHRPVHGTGVEVLEREALGEGAGHGALAGARRAVDRDHQGLRAFAAALAPCRLDHHQSVIQLVPKGRPSS